MKVISLGTTIDKFNFLSWLLFREWYGYHFPELVKIVNDNYMYARVVKLIKNRKEFDESQMELLEETVMDGAKAQAIVDASNMSMGVFYIYKTFF